MIKRVKAILVWVGIISNLIIANPQNQSTDLYTLDSIIVVLIGEENTELVTKSDIERPGLSGEIRNLDELILELLVYLDAKKHKILPDDQAIDEYLATIQRENNLTSVQLVQIFASAGYTLEEGRAFLKRIQAVNTMIDFKVRSNLIVPRKDVERYYAENPLYTEAAYLISRAEVPITGDAKKQRAKIERSIAKKKTCALYDWSDSFWIKQSHIAEDKKAICALEPGQMVITGDNGSAFEVFRLIEKEEPRLFTLEERYQDISRVLQKPRYEELMNRYKESLFKDITIIHL